MDTITAAKRQYLSGREMHSRLSGNPSPSNDEWFENPENLKHVFQGIREACEGKTKPCTLNQIQSLLQI